MQELQSLEERCAFHYICAQLGVLSPAELRQTSVALAAQGLRESDPVLVRTCASMTFVAFASAPVDFSQAEAVLRECKTALERMGDAAAGERALLELERAELVRALAGRFPVQVSRFLLDSGEARACVDAVLSPGDLNEPAGQEGLLAQTVVALALKEAIGPLRAQNTPEAAKCAAEAEQLLSSHSKDPNILTITYDRLVEDGLGNELRRGAARNATAALAPEDGRVVEKIAETLSQVAKSSSITAFLESLRDLEAVSALVARDEAILVQILDTVLACAQKYERNVLVMARVVEFMKSFAEYPALVHSGCFEQLDAFTEDLLDERAVAAQYLELVERLLRAKLDVLDVSINSLQRIRRFHAADDLLTA